MTVPKKFTHEGSAGNTVAWFERVARLKAAPQQHTLRACAGNMGLTNSKAHQKLQRKEFEGYRCIVLRRLAWLGAVPRLHGHGACAQGTGPAMQGTRWKLNLKRLPSREGI